MRLPPKEATAHYAVTVADLANLEPSELDLQLEALPELPADLGRLAGPLHADIRLELKGQHLLLHAKADGDLQLVCHRCLREFPHHAALKVDEHMVVQAEQPIEELEWEMDTVAESIEPDEPLDLVDWLRQHLILGLPAKQICEASCEIPQTAVTDETLGDPRWAALSRLATPQQGDDHAST